MREGSGDDRQRRPRISLIAALAENRVIGRQGNLPWHLPADLRRFKALTMGHTLVMGRRTFESIGRALPGRRSLVLSRDPDYRPAAEVEVVGSLEEALDRARAAGEDEVFIIGGAEVYRAALPLAHRLYLTLVHAEVEGDVRFPEVDLGEWRLLEERHRPPADDNPLPHTFRVYARIPTGD